MSVWFYSIIYKLYLTFLSKYEYASYIRLACKTLLYLLSTIKFSVVIVCSSSKQLFKIFYPTGCDW